MIDECTQHNSLFGKKFFLVHRRTPDEFIMNYSLSSMKNILLR